MNIEHVAVNVSDPVAMAEWYTHHLGMRTVRRVAGPPHTHFLADESGRVVLEMYRQTVAPVPDYAAMDPMVLHIAFAAPQIEETRQRLLAAGATSAGEITRTSAGDQLAMLRDPWGLPIQLVRRAHPLMDNVNERTAP